MTALASNLCTVGLSPGPWSIRRPNAFDMGTYICDGKHRRIAFPTENATAADIALLSHARELLEMVVTCQSECAECDGSGVSDDTHEPCEQCKDLRSLIYRATGRVQP